MEVVESGNMTSKVEDSKWDIGYFILRHFDDDKKPQVNEVITAYNAQNGSNLVLNTQRPIVEERLRTLYSISKPEINTDPDQLDALERDPDPKIDEKMNSLARAFDQENEKEQKIIAKKAIKIIKENRHLIGHPEVIRQKIENDEGKKHGILNTTLGIDRARHYYVTYFLASWKEDVGLAILKKELGTIDDDLREAQKAKQDFKNRELKRLKILEKNEELKKTVYEYMEKVTDDNDVVFLDRHNFFPKRAVTMISGPTGSLKSIGSISYLIQENVRTAYYSENEIHDFQLKKICKTFGRMDLMVWLKINKFKNFDEFLNFPLDDFDCLFLDPSYPFWDNENSYKDVSLFLSKIQKKASRDNIAILITRNQSKKEGVTGVNRASGSAAWNTVPRSVVLFEPCQTGSKLRPKWSKHVSSLAYVAKHSLSEKNENKLLVEIRERIIEDKTYKYASVVKTELKGGVDELIKSVPLTVEDEIRDVLKDHGDWMLIPTLKDIVANSVKKSRKTIQRAIHNMAFNKFLVEFDGSENSSKRKIRLKQ